MKTKCNTKDWGEGMLLKLVYVCVQSMYAVAWRRYRVHHSDGLEQMHRQRA